MVVIPGDRIRIGDRPPVVVAEAYYRGEQVQIITSSGRVIWIHADAIAFTPPPASWER